MAKKYVLKLYFLVIVLANNIEASCDKNITIPCISKHDMNCYDTLNDFELKVINHNTCILLSKDQVLNKTISFTNTSHIKIAGLLEDGIITITCQNNESGLEFLSGDNIQLQGLRFEECGHQKISSAINPVCQNLNSTMIPTPNISSAVFFYNTQNIELKNVRFFHSHGYSLVTYDIKGNITLKDLHFENNSIIKYIYNGTECSGYSSGGAIYMEYTQKTPSPTFVSNVTIQNSNFTHNHGDRNTSILEGQGFKESHVGFGRGSALGIVSRGSASNIDITVKDCQFKHNDCSWGGAVYVRFRSTSSNNTVHILSSKFHNNDASFSGGGIFSTTTQPRSYNNNIKIENCEFKENQALVGGAFGKLHSCNGQCSKQLSIQISNTTFIKNKANLGSAIHFRRVTIELTDVFIKNNQAIDQGNSISGQGAIYAFESHIIFKGANNISNNNDTAFVVDCTETSIQGAIDFHNNTGENGGAIALYGESHLQLSDKTELNFQNNIAHRRGGAIFVELHGPSVRSVIVVGLKIRKCFLSFVNSTSLEYGVKNFKGKVSFMNDRAEINGNSIFITSLDSCIIKSNEIKTDPILSWPGFSVTPNITSQIMTRPINITSNDSDWQTSPGTEFSPQVLLYDELNNLVNDAINVKLILPKNGDVKIASMNHRFIVTKDNKITITFIGKNQQKSQTNFSVLLSLTTSNISYTVHNRSLLPCYFGYTLLHGRCKCEVIKNQAKGIAFCIGDKKIYLYKNRWASPNQKAIETDQEITVDCPPGYCKNCKSNESLYGQMCLYKPHNPDQCVPTRNPNSRVCSECLSPTDAVQMGGEDCAPCNGANRYAIFKLLLMFFCVFILVLLVILLNIDIYTTFLNGFLYYYQVVGCLTTAAFTPWGFNGFFMGIVSLRGGGGSMPAFCLFDNFNNLHKNLFNYFIPASMVVSLLIISAISKRPNNWFSRNNCLKAFTIISVFAYQDISRITFVLLKHTRTDLDGARYVWVYARVGYFSNEHLPYAIVAICFGIFIVIGFPTCLALSSELVALHSKYVQNPFARMIAVFENFNTCFKPRYIRFAGLYFISRAVILSVETFVWKTPNQNVIQVIICCIICTMFAYMKPYKDKWLNVFDLTLLMNLTVVSILSLQSRSYIKMQIRCSDVINVLILIPIIVVFIRLVYIYLPFFYGHGRKLYKRITHGKLKRTEYPKRLLMNRDSNVEEEEEEEDDDGGYEQWESQN